MPDYPHLLTIAQKLINNAGRIVTLTKLGSTVPDPTKPWRGPADPRSPVGSSATYKAAFLILSGHYKLGLTQTTMDLAKKSDATCLIASSDNLETYQELTDSTDGRTYKILGSEGLKPGSLQLLWFLVLSR